MANVPFWFQPAAYFNQKLASLGDSWNDLSLRIAFNEAGYGTEPEGLFEHFQTFGQYEGLSPNGYFSASQYLHNKTLDYYGTKTVTTQQVESVRLMMLDSGMTPWQHYIDFGAAEGLNPSASFDAGAYMDAKLAQMQKDDPSGAWTMDKLNQAFKDSGLNALTHYYGYGKDEGLTPQNVVNYPGETYSLSTADDTIYGTAGNDFFNAPIGTLNDRDYIDGSGGSDTLKAVLSSKEAYQQEATMPTITNVEKIVLQAQHTSANTGNNMPFAAALDAQNISGMKELQNDNSRASLVVEDVRSYSNDMTITWSNADPGRGDAGVNIGTPTAGGVDYHVYFNPQHLKAAGSSSAETNVQILDAMNAQVNDQPLKGHPYGGLTVQYTPDGGASQLITLDLVKYAKAEDYVGTKATYTSLVKAFNEVIKALGLEGKLEAVLGEPFTDGGSNATGYYEGTGNYVTIKSSGGSVRTKDDSGNQIEGTGWAYSGGGDPDTVLISSLGTSTQDCPLIQTYVQLDNVGRVQWGDISDCLPNNSIYGSESGDMVIGSMANRGGVERFDVTVDKGSWLTSLSSTNNALRMVTAQNGNFNGDSVNGNTVLEANKAGYGQLFIGAQLDNDPHFGYMNDYTSTNTFPGNQPGLPSQAQTAHDLAQWTDRGFLLSTDGLTDVKWFHGQNFDGNINLGASITANSFQKYLRDVDGTWAPESNNAPGLASKDQFQYNLGKNSDILNMSLDGGIAADKDFQLVVSAGEGNDFINFRFDGATNNQVINSNNLRNVILNGDSGNDTIKVWQNTAVTVNGGSGNDVIFVSQAADDRGAEQNAAFVFNVANLADRAIYMGGAGATLYNDIQSTATTVDFSLGTAAPVNSSIQLQVAVTFKGITVTASVNGTMNGGSGSVNGGTVTTDALNNAIIKAINDHSVLGNILVAKDGAGHSLLIESLIDGEMVTKDLSIGLRYPNATNSVTNWDSNDLYDTNFATIGVAEATAVTDLFVFSNHVDGTATTKMAFDIGVTNTSFLQAGKVINLDVQLTNDPGKFFVRDYVLRGSTPDEILVNLLEALRTVEGYPLSAGLGINGSFVTGDTSDGKVTFVANSAGVKNAPNGFAYNVVDTVETPTYGSFSVSAPKDSTTTDPMSFTLATGLTDLASKIGETFNFQFELGGRIFAVKNFILSDEHNGASTLTNDQLLVKILDSAVLVDNGTSSIKDVFGVGGIGTWTYGTGATPSQTDGTLVFTANPGDMKAPTTAGAVSYTDPEMGGVMTRGDKVLEFTIDGKTTADGTADTTFSLNFANPDALALYLKSAVNDTITIEIDGEVFIADNNSTPGVDNYTGPGAGVTSTNAIIADFLATLKNANGDSLVNAFDGTSNAGRLDPDATVGKFNFKANDTVAGNTTPPAMTTGGVGYEYNTSADNLYKPDLPIIEVGNGGLVDGTKTGTDSLNRVDGGSGDDVIVLNVDSNVNWYDTLVFSESIGNDTVFNFQAADRIDLSAYGKVNDVFGNYVGDKAVGQVSAADVVSLISSQFGASTSGAQFIQYKGSDTYLLVKVENDNNATVTAQEVQIMGTVTFGDLTNGVDFTLTDAQLLPA